MENHKFCFGFLFFSIQKKEEEEKRSMALQVTNINGIKIYNLSAGKTLPEWLSQKGAQALRKNQGEAFL